MQRKIEPQGFTLIEILVALFIFTILAFILMNGLHNIISFQSGTERKAARLRDLQMALLLLSRDMQQAVNRPITLGNNREEAAFRGSNKEVTFTQIGAADNHGDVPQTILSRTRYYVFEHALWRERWETLDQTTKTKVAKRELLSDIESADMQYVDQAGKLHGGWPLDGQLNQALPRAIVLTLNLARWGTIKQTYVINATNYAILSEKNQ
jgi:general secretion pathway protein J